MNTYCCHCYEIYAKDSKHECIGSLKAENSKLKALCIECSAFLARESWDMEEHTQHQVNKVIDKLSTI